MSGALVTYVSLNNMKTSIIFSVLFFVFFQVTGRLEPKYPKWKKKLKFYGGSVPVVLFCLFIAFEMMLFYFWMQVS